MKDEMKHGLQAEYGQGRPRKSADSLDLSATSPGQKCPRQCPYPEDHEIEATTEPLGAPLSINEVANLIGVSVWTVRMKFLPAGLPHLRSGPQGKLIFYKNQIIRWLLVEQRKGGTIS